MCFPIKRLLFRVIVVIFIFPFPADAQDQPLLPTLNMKLKPNQEVRIQNDFGQIWQGRFEGVGADSIFIRLPETEIVIGMPVDEVDRLWQKANRKTATIVGSVVGGLGGLGLGMVALSLASLGCAYENSNCSDDSNSKSDQIVTLFLPTFFGAGLGGCLGGLVDSAGSDWKAVYVKQKFDPNLPNEKGE